MRVAVLGRSGILYETIDRLRGAGHEVVLVGTCRAADEYGIREKDFEEKAKSISAVFFNDAAINSEKIVSLLRSAGAEIAVSFNWLTVVGAEAAGCFKYGILNAHCGDLPRYRGNACPNWAILKGEKEYAISVHYMKPGELDSGDILIKRKYPIGDKTYITDIYENMKKVIPDMFTEAVGMIEKGHGKGEAQSTDPADSLRCYPRIPSDSFIDWNDTCENIIRNIRASSHPFSGAYCYCNGQKIYIFEAASEGYPAPCHVNPGQVISVDRDKGSVGIAASDGIVSVKRVTADGVEHDASEILKSTRIRLNFCLPDEVYGLRRELAELKGEISALKEEISALKEH
ncbi:MAG: hypothetical protein K6G58_03090 [Lachnospiraceae bacterium]|nr:hypothetical protein [Lachnospiraceae bacterium]